MTEALVLTHSEDRVLARLHRPEVRNAIDQALVDELHALCADLERRPRVLIITGAPPGKDAIFASGADISQLVERRREDGLRGINSRLFARIAALPMPVIAAVDGAALGGGAELAYAADFRIGSTRARFGNPEIGLGIIAAAGGTWRLAALIGESRAKEVLLAGRMLDAAEAERFGLLTEVCEPERLIERAHALADRICGFDSFAVQLTKKAMDAPREAHPYIDDVAQSLLFESETKRERMRAFLEGRSTSGRKER